MGACATKPKAEAGEAPVPKPEKEEATGIVSEKKEVVVGEEGLKKVEGEIVVDEDKEIVDDDKRRSLGNLFQKEGKDSTEEVTTPTNPVKQEELSVNQNPTEVFHETNPNETGKTECPVEQTPKEVIEAVDDAPTTVVLVEEAIEVPVTIETQEPEEKEIVEDKPAAAETKKSETQEESEAIEEKTATVTQKPETAVDEKTTEGN
ncbi:hypothetical protein Vadar_013891 [Vaccinium darrowii]|uniref:Uncharacterized protein n=1 Tax=Vaccinium darrowii TaxID=229202 RepID=A0ACB7Z3X6_9ERIC|nr:hypothetical protein Vadar_013891 [Vaccinium darrowii]